MLLSMYASYHWAKISKKPYVLRMAFFIILMSFVSTFFVAGFLFAIYYPLSWLSFPFLSSVEQLHSYTPVTAYKIHFFTLEIVSISPQNAPLYVFSFFLLVNLVGAILGYWINKRLLTESFKRNLFDFFFQSWVISLLGCYTLLGCYIISSSYLRVTGWFAIANIIYLFCAYFFWIPALIATTIYGIKWFRRRKE